MIYLKEIEPILKELDSDDYNTLYGFTLGLKLKSHQLAKPITSKASPPHPPEAIYPDDVDYTPEEYAEEYEDEYAMAASYH